MVEEAEGETWQERLRSSAGLRRRLESFARNPRHFPGGEHATATCTGCARLIVQRFGGEIRGYWSEENPEASAGHTEGGHDFAIVAGRVIVDPWLFHCYREPPVLDMQKPEERETARQRYGGVLLTDPQSPSPMR